MTGRPWTAQEDAILRACDTRAAAEAALAPRTAEAVRKRAWWHGWTAAAFCCCAVLIANAVGAPDRPALALAGAFAVGGIGWIAASR